MGKSKKEKKEKKSKERRTHHSNKKKKKKSKRSERPKSCELKSVELEEPKADYSIPLDLMSSKSHAPETPEEYQKRQSRIRHEDDPVTGRRRLIKGDGEILEEIVTRKRHVDINKVATEGDGQFFQKNACNKAQKN